MHVSLHHEAAYRGPALLERLGRCGIVVCGAGALGAPLVEGLARQGARRLTVIDRDRVEPGNLGTQPWLLDDVGTPKAQALAWRVEAATPADVRPQVRTLDATNAAKLLRGADLVLDVFDNTAARAAVQAAVRASGTPCLHVGLAADYAEVVWEAQGYRVPDDAGLDPCDYPLARNLVGLAVAVASEAVLSWLAEGARRGFTITLRDLAVRSYR